MFVTLHVVLHMAAMFLVSALNRGGWLAKLAENMVSMTYIEYAPPPEIFKMFTNTRGDTFV